VSNFGIASRHDSALPLFDQELYRKQEARPPLREQQREAGIQARFERFHADNPHIYAELVRMSRRLVASGRRHFGVGMLWETLRYRVAITTDSDDEFKLNDHYRSRYARLIMASEPDLAGVFELRELREEAK